MVARVRNHPITPTIRFELALVEIFAEQLGAGLQAAGLGGYSPLVPANSVSRPEAEM